MSEDLKRIQQRARELARSGRFIGSRGVAFELQFEPGYAQAFRWNSQPCNARGVGSPVPRG